MKILKFTLIACITFFISCGSDDNGSSTPDPIEVIPAITVDVDAILALPADSDITDLVSFGQPSGVSTSDYTAELAVNDMITLGQPTGLQAGDVFLYSAIIFENPAEDALAQLYLECILNGAVNNFCLDVPQQEIGLRVVDSDPTVDLTWKYDIECYIVRGVTEFGPYIIDPKLKLKSNN